MNRLVAASAALTLTWTIAQAPALAQRPPRPSPPAGINPGQPARPVPPSPAGRPPLAQPPPARELKPSVLVKRDEANTGRVLRGDLATGAVRELYRSTRGTVDDLQVAPDDEYVGVIETVGGKQENGEYVVAPVNRLVILRPDGTQVRTVEGDVRQYTFSPDGSRLAYITGTYYEGGAGFKPTGTFILDIASGQTQRIQGAELSVELNWIANQQENALYLKTLDPKGNAIRRFDLTRNSIEGTQSPAFRISPDGRYYMTSPYETIEAGTCEPGAGDDTCLRVYERQSGRAIPFFQSRSLGTQLGWVYGQGHALLFSKREAVKVDQQINRGGRAVRGRVATQVRDADNAIYDVESRQVLERFRGVVGSVKESGWIGSPRMLVVRDAAVTQPTAAVALDGVTLRRTSPPTRVPINPMAAVSTKETMSIRPGADLPGADYRSVPSVPSPEACEAACLGDAKCVAFSYLRPAAGQSGECQLKASVPTARPDRRFVSGIKVRRGQ